MTLQYVPVFGDLNPNTVVRMEKGELPIEDSRSDSYGRLARVLGFGDEEHLRLDFALTILHAAQHLLRSSQGAPRRDAEGTALLSRAKRQLATIAAKNYPLLTEIQLGASSTSKLATIEKIRILPEILAALRDTSGWLVPWADGGLAAYLEDRRDRLAASLDWKKGETESPRGTGSAVVLVGSERVFERTRRIGGEAVAALEAYLGQRGYTGIRPGYQSEASEANPSRLRQLVCRDARGSLVLIQFAAGIMKNSILADLFPQITRHVCDPTLGLGTPSRDRTALTVMLVAEGFDPGLMHSVDAVFALQFVFLKVQGFSAGTESLYVFEELWRTDPARPLTGTYSRPKTRPAARTSKTAQRDMDQNTAGEEHPTEPEGPEEPA